MSGPSVAGLEIVVSMNKEIIVRADWSTPRELMTNPTPQGLTHVKLFTQFYCWLAAKSLNTGK